MSERLALPSDAQSFYMEGMRQFDQVLVNELEAKQAILLAMVSPLEGPTGAALLGGTGGGKTSLAEASPYLIQDIRPDGVTNLPPQSDLRPVQVVGGRVESTIETESHNGQKHVERKSQTVEGKIHEDTQIILLNEIDTINPQTLNSIREVLASGTLVNTEGTTALKGLIYFVSTKNPLDNRGKFEVTDAMASRHAVGAYMGHNSKQNEDTVEHIFSGFRPKRPEQLASVTDTDTLRAIGAYAAHGISFPQSLAKETAKRVVKASEALVSDYRIDDTPQRLSVQIEAVARANAALYGEKHMSREDIDTALRYALVARIGLRGMARGHKVTIPEIVDDLVRS